jgi:hypothetical protein
LVRKSCLGQIFIQDNKPEPQNTAQDTRVGVRDVPGGGADGGGREDACGGDYGGRGGEVE